MDGVDRLAGVQPDVTTRRFMYVASKIKMAATFTTIGLLRMVPDRFTH